MGICPTHVGMNRNVSWVYVAGVHLPHACGDEPVITGLAKWLPGDLPHACGDEPIAGVWVDNEGIICPTHVGMNRSWQRWEGLMYESAPRMWG